MCSQLVMIFLVEGIAYHELDESQMKLMKVDASTISHQLINNGP
uniref:Uncharacterized protein n=1 Tax=Arundo donax TaxID=35708 RepID=A0A0A8Y4C3_ARUDO